MEIDQLPADLQIPVPQFLPTVARRLLIPAPQPPPFPEMDLPISNPVWGSPNAVLPRAVFDIIKIQLLIPMTICF